LEKKDWLLESALKERDWLLEKKEMHFNESRRQANEEISKMQVKLLRLQSAVNIRGAMGKEERAMLSKSEQPVFLDCSMIF
jgi:hypothetical protein